MRMLDVARRQNIHSSRSCVSARSRRCVSAPEPEAEPASVDGNASRAAYKRLCNVDGDLAVSAGTETSTLSVHLKRRCVVARRAAAAAAGV